RFIAAFSVSRNLPKTRLCAALLRDRRAPAPRTLGQAPTGGQATRNPKEFRKGRRGGAASDLGPPRRSKAATSGRTPNCPPRNLERAIHRRFSLFRDFAKAARRTLDAGTKAAGHGVGTRNARRVLPINFSRRL